MKPVLFPLLLAATLWMPCHGFAKEILTNHLQVLDAPAWLTETMVEQASNRVQNYLEWDVRRIPVKFHADAAGFRAAGGVGPRVKAYFLKSDNAIHIGPDVTKETFKPIMAHEMVHVIFRQKYGAAIPVWLEEGLANYVGAEERADRAWLQKQTLPAATSLKHPATDPTGSRVHYQMSTAVIEMIAEKCDLKDLLHLSVGRKMETYLKTLCEMNDVDATFKKWLAQPVKPNQKGKRKWF